MMADLVTLALLVGVSWRRRNPLQPTAPGSSAHPDARGWNRTDCRLSRTGPARILLSPSAPFALGTALRVDTDADRGEKIIVSGDVIAEADLESNMGGVREPAQRLAVAGSHVLNK